MFFLRRCINQSVHYLRLYRSLYSNRLVALWEAAQPESESPPPVVKLRKSALILDSSEKNPWLVVRNAPRVGLAF